MDPQFNLTAICNGSLTEVPQNICMEQNVRATLFRYDKAKALHRVKPFNMTDHKLTCVGYFAILCHPNCVELSDASKTTHGVPPTNAGLHVLTL